jgi:hypothetical protein
VQFLRGGLGRGSELPVTSALLGNVDIQPWNTLKLIYIEGDNAIVKGAGSGGNQEIMRADHLTPALQGRPELGVNTGHFQINGNHREEVQQVFYKL